MANRERIRELAEKAWSELGSGHDAVVIEQAILQGIREALEAPVSEAMIDAAFNATVWPDLNRATTAEVIAGLRSNMRKEFAAMSAARLRELGDE